MKSHMGLAEPEEVRTGMISDGVLETLAVPATAGRWLSQMDQDPHGAKTVVFSYGYWQRRFGGDRSGRTQHQVDSQSGEIVGVMPRGFRLVDRDFDLLIPLAFDRTNQILAGFGFHGIARLKLGFHYTGRRRCCTPASGLDGFLVKRPCTTRISMKSGESPRDFRPLKQACDWQRR